MSSSLLPRVWESPYFHEAVQLVEVAWLNKSSQSYGGEGLPLEEAEKIIRAAAILACSDQQSHRETAFRAATCVYDLIGSTELPMDQALRVVLSRLGNFPSFATKANVNAALPQLPFSLVTEELEKVARSVAVNVGAAGIMYFQYDLWNKFSANERIAI